MAPNAWICCLHRAYCLLSNPKEARLLDMVMSDVASQLNVTVHSLTRVTSLQVEC